MKTYIFKNEDLIDLACVLKENAGSIISSMRTIKLELDGDQRQLTLRMAENGWVLTKIGTDNVFNTCECGAPIFQNWGKYCVDCQKQKDFDGRQMNLPIF